MTAVQVEAKITAGYQKNPTLPRPLMDADKSLPYFARNFSIRSMARRMFSSELA